MNLTEGATYLGVLHNHDNMHISLVYICYSSRRLSNAYYWCLLNVTIIIIMIMIMIMIIIIIIIIITIIIIILIIVN